MRPANLTVNLSVSGNAQSDSPTSIVIPVGETSASRTLKPQDGQTLTADFASTPLTHTGLTLSGVTIVTAKAIPTFADVPVPDQSYFQQVAIDPLQLPLANLSLLSAGIAPADLAYSLTATITDGDEAALADNNLPPASPSTRTPAP